MSELRDIVTEITKEHGYKCTDKHRSVRQHLCLYEQILPPYQHTAKKVVELGVGRGGSIRMWQKYFTSATIYAADIRLKNLSRVRKLDNVSIIQVDQSKQEDLDKLAAEGPFDVFIDDGSHIWSHQVNTFKTIWPSIKPGGLYVLEDTCTSYPEWLDTEGKVRVPRRYNDQDQPAIEYFKDLVDHINFDGCDYNKRETKYSDLQLTIDLVCFRTNLVYVTKRVVEKDPMRW